MLQNKKYTCEGLALALLLLLTSGIQAQCEHPFDFHTFQAAGPAVNGDWVVNSTGATVSQEINAHATFYVSPIEFSSVRLKGQILVSPTTTDDDIVGMCFGLQSPDAATGYVTDVDTWLIDWKSEFQTNAEEGFSLVHIDDNFDFDNPDDYMFQFWNHVETPGFLVEDTA